MTQSEAIELLRAVLKPFITDPGPGMIDVHAARAALESTRTAPPSPASDAELPSATAQEIEAARADAKFFGRPESDIPALIAFEHHRAEQSKIPGMPGLTGAISNFIAGYRAASTRTASDTRTAALEEAAAACEAWGNAKVAKWADDPEMCEDAKARAWDALQCAATIRALPRATASAAGETECDAALGHPAQAGGIDAVRAAFEGWHTKENDGLTFLEREEDGRYVSVHTQGEWHVWECAAAAALADGEVPPESELRFAIINLKREFDNNEVRDIVSKELGDLCQGGNTQPVSVESARPAEVDEQAAFGSMEEFAEAADLVGIVARAKTNGEALGAILKYRKKIRSELLAARTQVDAGKDAERFQRAIAAEDNAETLYAAVMNNAPDGNAIRAEFDAATTKPENI